MEKRRSIAQVSAQSRGANLGAPGLSEVSTVEGVIENLELIEGAWSSGGR